MVDLWPRLTVWARTPLCQGTLLLILLVTVFLYKPLFTGEILTSSDVLYELDPLWQSLAPVGFTASENGTVSDQVALFYPWQAYTREALGRGQWAFWNPPLWNPYVNSGHPFVGNLQSALYDPLHLLSLLVPFPQSLAVLAWLRLFVAGFFTLCLALELGLSRRAAYLAMIVFTFAMPQIVWLGYTKASVLAWLPALWFFSARLIRRGSWRDVAWLAFAMTAQLMGGHPEGSIYVQIGWGTFALYGLWYLWRHTQQPPLRATLQLGLAGVLGVGLSAVQWLPVLETILQSKAITLRNQFVFDWKPLLFQWDEWVGGITLLIPNFFGNPRFDTYWYPLSYSNFNEQNFFMGITTLALALLAMAAGRAVIPSNISLDRVAQNDFWQMPRLWEGPGAYFAWLGIIGTGLALSLPGFTLLAELPGLHLVSPGRWRGIVLAAVALLAGYGLDRYLAALVDESSPGDAANAQPWREQTLRRWLWIVGTLGMLSSLGALAAWMLLRVNYARVLSLAQTQASAAQADPLNFRTYDEYLAVATQRLEYLLMSLQPTHWPTYMPLWIAIFLIGVHLLLRRWKMPAPRRAALMGGLLLLLVLVELWRVAYDYNPAIARTDVFPTPPLIEELRQHVAANTAQVEPFRIVGINRVLSPNLNMVFRLEDVRGYEPSGTERYNDLMARVDGVIFLYPVILFRHAQSPLLDFLNVKYAFSDVPLDAPWELIAQEGGIMLYLNPEALPRAFLVYDVQPVTTPSESLALTLSADFDVRQQVVIEAATASAGQALALLQPPASPGRSTITRYAPGEIALDVESATEGMLVLSTSYAAGWRATLDGAETPLYVANHAFHAIRVPSGSHTVVFTYAPVSATMGAWISGGCLAFLLALLAWPYRKATKGVPKLP